MQVRDVLAQAARVERLEPSRALELAGKALELLGPREASGELNVGIGEALWRRGRALFFLRRLDDAAEALTEAKHIFLSASDSDGVVRAESVLGMVFSAAGHGSAALQILTDAGALAEVDEDVSEATRVMCATHHASALRREGRLDEACAAFDALLERTSSSPVSPDAMTSALLNAASAAWQAGRVQKASELLERARALAEREGVTGHETWQLALEAWVWGRLGEHSEARRAAHAALALGGGDEGARTSATRALAHSLCSAPTSSAAERAEGLARLNALVEEARAKDWLGDLPIIMRDLSELHEAHGSLREALTWARNAHDAAQRAEHERARRRDEAERLRLRLSRVELEAVNLRERSAALGELNTRLRQVGQERVRLLYTVAHDLRTPLTAIRGAVSIFRRAPQSANELLEIIDESAHSMLTVIDEALSTDAIRAGRVPIHARPTDLGRLLRRIARGLSPLAERKSMQILVEIPEHAVVVDTDTPALARVMENLTTNALKFAPAQTTVRLVLAERDASVELEVHDHGPGFGPGETSDLFTFGTRGQATPTAGETSTGIGLHVVSDLVDALGGEVELLNGPAGGGIARVSLPRTPPEDAIRESFPPPTPRPPR